MKRNNWFIAFVVALAGELIAVMAESQLLQYIFKPLLMITLGGYFIQRTTSIQVKLKTPVLFALVFSWLGDVLLMFQHKDSLFFILGLVSFLIAHIFYIVFFHKLKGTENIKSRIWPLAVIVIYYSVLIFFLSPHLGDLKIPVRIYGIVISLMLMLALHMIFIKNRIAGQLLALGGLLFVISDSLLAIDKFYQSFQAAGFLVMITYAAAQFLLVEGARRYIGEKR
jgi:uncharacterized membrane protein YhhN